MLLILIVLPNMIYFVRTFLIMRARGVRLLCYRKGLIYCIHQKHVPNWLVEEMHPPHTPWPQIVTKLLSHKKQINANAIT